MLTQASSLTAGTLTMDGQNVGSALAWLLASTHVGGGSAVSVRSANGNYMTMGYGGSDVPVVSASTIGSYERFRILAAPGYMR